MSSLEQADSDAKAERILTFLNELLSTRQTIDPRPEGGFQIETDAGASFTFEITGATRLEVAERYFHHCRRVLTYVSGEHGVIRFSNARTAFRERSKSLLARLLHWGAQHSVSPSVP